MTRHLLLAAAAATFLPFSSASAAVLTVDCVTGPFLLPSTAVLAAANGDTIVVHPCPLGPYNDNVVISGRDDIHLVGAQRPTETGARPVGVGQLHTPAAVIDGTGLNGACISIQASTSISVTGFQLQNCSSGIENFGSRQTVVHGNRIQRNSFAGYFEAQGEGNVLTGNLLGFAQYGVYTEGTRELRILNNRIGFNRVDGIFLVGERLQATNNEVSGNGNTGIHSGFGGEHRIERNRVGGNPVANILIDPGVPLVDVIGNAAGGFIIDMSFSDLAENN